MKNTFALVRLIAAAAGLVAIVATFIDTAGRGPVNPFNFFGFFTIQSNIFLLVVLAIAGVLTLSGRPTSNGIVLARACATTYMVIVGIVYNTLLTNVAGGVTLEWANWVLHVALPIYAALDWILFGDKVALSWKQLWVPLIFPIVWVAVVLVRGATDGWVPYPFLDPSLGYGVVALYCVGIAVATIAMAAIVWALSRVRVLKTSPALATS